MAGLSKGDRFDDELLPASDEARSIVDLIVLDGTRRRAEYIRSSIGALQPGGMSALRLTMLDGQALAPFSIGRLLEGVGS